MSFQRLPYVFLVRRPGERWVDDAVVGYITASLGGVLVFLNPSCKKRGEPQTLIRFSSKHSICMAMAFNNLIDKEKLMSRSCIKKHTLLDRSFKLRLLCVSFLIGTTSIYAQTNPLITANPSASNAATGNATILLQPVMSSFNSVGVFCLPQMGSFTSTTAFPACFNLKWGDVGSPVPAGTAGALVGYEANITTAQTASDIDPSIQNGHAFGATISTSGGAPYHVLDGTVTVQTAAASVGGIDLNITKNVSGGSAYGGFFGSTGSVNGDYGIWIHGNWNVGLFMDGNNIRGSSNIGFSGSPSYFIDGSEPDTLRLSGGGSSGGMIIYGSGSGQSGTDGLIRFRNNSTDNTQGASIDPGSGNISANSFSAGSSAGVSCSGPPSSQFTVTAGIVTHC